MLSGRILWVRKIMPAGITICTSWNNNDEVVRLNVPSMRCISISPRTNRNTLIASIVASLCIWCWRLRWVPSCAASAIYAVCSERRPRPPDACAWRINSVNGKLAAITVRLSSVPSWDITAATARPWIRSSSSIECVLGRAAIPTLVIAYTSTSKDTCLSSSIRSIRSSWPGWRMLTRTNYPGRISRPIVNGNVPIRPVSGSATWSAGGLATVNVIMMNWWPNSSASWSCWLASAAVKYNIDIDGSISIAVSMDTFLSWVAPESKCDLLDTIDIVIYMR